LCETGEELGRADNRLEEGFERLWRKLKS